MYRRNCSSFHYSHTVQKCAFSRFSSTQDNGMSLKSLRTIRTKWNQTIVLTRRYDYERSYWCAEFCCTSSMGYVSRDFIAFWAHFAGMTILSVYGVFVCIQLVYVDTVYVMSSQVSPKEAKVFLSLYNKYKFRLRILMVVNSKSNKALKWRLPTWLDRTRLCDCKFWFVVSSPKDIFFLFPSPRILLLQTV